MHDAGDVILTNIQFTDTFEIKKRPAVILFKEYDNLVVAGITSNTEMNGIPLTKKEGAIKDSVIKLNYIFTISSAMVEKTLFHLHPDKRKMVFDALVTRLSDLNS
ncbi:MAG: type II toxin-antitoxin system PemK/MazF family toxin [Nanoarchaeota archaeon]|nr:type II toxin-antitoxin system PemK/MazF family toxin [Nanoarchaeota archaeon]